MLRFGVPCLQVRCGHYKRRDKYYNHTDALWDVRKRSQNTMGYHIQELSEVIKISIPLKKLTKTSDLIESMWFQILDFFPSSKLSNWFGKRITLSLLKRPLPAIR